ncbi:ImcF-related family protein [Paraburkholderia sp. BR10872]|uniref:ImcF-related family protein n=1 Tax=Paraburkholderia sp. BR10872 TaxID=3236989 RepID=UPI0034D1655D
MPCTGCCLHHFSRRRNWRDPQPRKIRRTQEKAMPLRCNRARSGRPLPTTAARFTAAVSAFRFPRSPPGSQRLRLASGSSARWHRVSQTAQRSVQRRTRSRNCREAELRQRYFDDYARAWAQFLNSLRWQSASTLSATADQLSLLGDPQRSPLVTLMNAIVYQAGAGVTAQSLSDTLVSKAQHLVGADEKDPSKRAQPQLAPLANAFGPILRLSGSDPALVFEVKHQLLRALKAASNRKDADKPALARRIGELQGEMTVLDPARALALAQ